MKNKEILEKEFLRLKKKYIQDLKNIIWERKRLEECLFYLKEIKKEIEIKIKQTEEVKKIPKSFIEKVKNYFEPELETPKEEVEMLSFRIRLANFIHKLESEGIIAKKPSDHRDDVRGYYKMVSFCSIYWEEDYCLATKPHVFKFINRELRCFTTDTLKRCKEYANKTLIEILKMQVMVKGL